MEPEAQRHPLAALLVAAFGAVEVLAELGERHAGFPIRVEHVGWGQHDEGVCNRTWGGTEGEVGSHRCQLCLPPGSSGSPENKHSPRSCGCPGLPCSPPAPRDASRAPPSPGPRSVPPAVCSSSAERAIHQRPAHSCLPVMIYHTHSFGRDNECFNYYIYPHRLLLSVSSPLRPPLQAHTCRQTPTAAPERCRVRDPPRPPRLPSSTPAAQGLVCEQSSSGAAHKSPAIRLPPAELDSTKGKVKRIQSHLSEGCRRAQLPHGSTAKGGRERCRTGEGGGPGGRSHLRLLVSAEEPEKSTSGGGRGSLSPSPSPSRGCSRPSAGGWPRLAHQGLCRARCVPRLLCQEARAGPEAAPWQHFAVTNHLLLLLLPPSRKEVCCCFRDSR